MGHKNRTVLAKWASNIGQHPFNGLGQPKSTDTSFKKNPVFTCLRMSYPIPTHNNQITKPTNSPLVTGYLERISYQSMQGYASSHYYHMAWQFHCIEAQVYHPGRCHWQAHDQIYTWVGKREAPQTAATQVHMIYVLSWVTVQVMTWLDTRIDCDISHDWDSCKGRVCIMHRHGIRWAKY